jgi:hypothetical protein
MDPSVNYDDNFNGAATIRANLPAWNDAAFKQRVKDAAIKKGIRPREALREAGVSSGYLDKTSLGRATDVIQNLAVILDVSPAYLAGWAEPSEAQAKPDPTQFSCANGYMAHEELLRVLTANKTLATQITLMAKLIATAADHLPKNSERDGSGG